MATTEQQTVSLDIIANVVERIPLDSLRPSPTNPRQEYDPDKLNELAFSIQAHGGLLQPIAVRQADGGHEIIAGERRCRAFRILRDLYPKDERWHSIDAIVRDVDEAEAAELQLIENLQREDIHPLDEGAGFARLLEMTPGAHHGAGGAGGQKRRERELRLPGDATGQAGAPRSPDVPQGRNLEIARTRLRPPAGKGADGLHGTLHV